MIGLEFDYEQNKVFMQANLYDYFSTVINKYYQKTQIEPNSVIFMAHSIQIQENKRIIDVMNQIEKINNKIYIAVFPLYINNKKVIEDSKEIICPKCSEQCLIKIEDYIIKLFDCKNNHSTIMKLDNFKESQKIDLGQIKCNNCNDKNLGNTYNHSFFYCNNCKINICPLCKEKHNKNHFIINYELKDYICPFHNNIYFKYCHNCKQNICMLCNQMHMNHKLELFENMISNPDNKRIELDNLKNEINIFNNNVKKIINGLNKLIENMETYYSIFNNIFDNYNINNKNYNILKNIAQINLTNNIYKEIQEINRNKNYYDKINKIFNIFYKMKGKNAQDPFNFYKLNTNENNNLNETNTLFLFSNVPSYIKKENKISKDSIYRCNYCPYTPLMRIMYKGYKIYMEYRCQNGHYSYEKLYYFYKRNKINSINSVICCVGYEVNDGKIDFYYCNDCQKYFCEKDMKAHERKDGKPHNLINLNYLDNTCNEHISIVHDYCLDCHKNICKKCKSHSNHKKVSLSKLIIGDSKLNVYRNKLNELKGNYNNFYNECDKTIKEVLDYIENFNENLRQFKNVNDYSFNICEDLLNSYQFLKNKNSLNYEIIENINSIMNFNDIKFTMDKNFHCLARLIYINSIIKLEYNTLFKNNKNFINFDFQITEEEEQLIKAKNNNTNLKYKKIFDKNFGYYYYGYFQYNPNSDETKYEINGFGIKIGKDYKYIGEFKDGESHGHGIYYFDSGAYKFTYENYNNETFKLYGLSGQIDICIYTKIKEKYQKNGVYFIEYTNGTKKIYLVKNNNFDDYGIIYNINGEFYEGYNLSGEKHGYGIFNSQAENKIRIGIFDRGGLKFGRKVFKDCSIEGEFRMGLEDGYISVYDRLKRKQFEGQYKDGKREGFGISYYENGNISYKGYFTNDLEDKFAFMYTSLGKLFYLGHIEKGKRKGFGIYYAYNEKGNYIHKFVGNWINDETIDGYCLKKFVNGDYFFGFTKMFVFQTIMKYKEGDIIYIGEIKKDSYTREGYGETTYSNGKKERGIYINDKLILKANK